MVYYESRGTICLGLHLLNVKTTFPVLYKCTCLFSQEPSITYDRKHTVVLYLVPNRVGTQHSAPHIRYTY